jgi:glutamyl/glutaminyl-tRNA synthetase
MDAEELVIARLTQVEEAETQMAQIRDDLNSDTMRANASNDPAETKRKADELAKREADVEALKFTLMEDRKIVEQQKRELNQMKGTILQEFEASLGGQVTGASDPESESLQASLERRAAELEMAGKELEERSRYVDSVEDSLVERLGQLTEREAFLEQGEINQGIRSD